MIPPLPDDSMRMADPAGRGTGIMSADAPKPGLALPSVWVIDDYADAAESLAMVLRACGYVVSVARSGREALVLTPLPDAVILELRLRDADGCDLVKSLRARAGGGHASFIAVTTCGRPEDIARSKAAGITAHLVKPAEVRDVLSALGGVRREMSART